MVFKIGIKQETVIVELKHCLTEVLVLQIYNLKAKSTKLHTDASQWGFGTVYLK